MNIPDEPTDDAWLDAMYAFEAAVPLTQRGHAEWIGRMQAALKVLAVATDAPPKINIRCETRAPPGWVITSTATAIGDTVIGTCALNVVRVDQEDDGSWTAITDYWPCNAQD